MSGAVTPPLPVCTGKNLEAKFLIRCSLGIRVFQYVTPCRCASSCLSLHNPAAQGRAARLESSAALLVSFCHQPLCVTGVWQCSRDNRSELRNDTDIVRYVLAVSFEVVACRNVV